MHIGLDGGFTLDGYGHESNATCSAKAESLVAEGGREQRVRRQQVSMENRNAPALAQEPRLPTWSNLESLEEIRRSVMEHEVAAVKGSEIWSKEPEAA